METNLVNLKKIFDRSVEYVKYIDDSGCMQGRLDASPFWDKILNSDPERKNYPDFNEMLTMRRGVTYPMSDSGTQADLDSEYQVAQATYSVVSQSVPESYLKELKESLLGSPLTFDFHGQMLSAGAIINALTAYRIISWCNTTGLSDRPLRVLEIGPGYGQVAYQLFNSLKIQSYSIVDLPENLFLSSFYLQANFPEKSAHFVQNRNLWKNQVDLLFLVPPFLDSLPGPFDLVVNSYSFQEMTRCSVDEYFAYVSSHLSDYGIFYSLNAHGKSEVAWPSDYPIERFQLRSILPIRKFPHHSVFATNPYEVVMSKRMEAPQSVEARSQCEQLIDALGGILQIGLHDDVLQCCERFSQGKLETTETEWLQSLCDFQHSSDYSTKKQHLNQMRSSGYLPGVVDYLDGSLNFVIGNGGLAELLLTKASKALHASHAVLITFTMLSCLAHKNGDQVMGKSLCSRAQALAPHLGLEISRQVSNYDGLAIQVARKLHLDLPQAHNGFRGLVGLLHKKLRQNKLMAG